MNENFLDVLRELQETKDEEAGIYLDGNQVDIFDLVGERVTVVGVDMWFSILKHKTLRKVDLEALASD